MTAASDSVAAAIALLAGIGPLRQRKMFGGTYIYCDDLFIAVVHDDILYLKANIHTAQAFIDLGLRPFSYLRQGELATLQYYPAPAEALRNRDAMQYWASKALAAAKQDAAAKKSRRVRGK